MIRTLEATIEEQGVARLLEPIALAQTRRAFVTILEEPPVNVNEAARTPRPEPTQQEIDEATARLRSTIASYDSPPDADNEHIDAELAREYGDDHAER